MIYLMSNGCLPLILFWYSVHRNVVLICQRIPLQIWEISQNLHRFFLFICIGIKLEKTCKSLKLIKIIAFILFIWSNNHTECYLQSRFQAFIDETLFNTNLVWRKTIGLQQLIAILLLTSFIKLWNQGFITVSLRHNMYLNTDICEQNGMHCSGRITQLTKLMVWRDVLRLFVCFYVFI